MDNTPPIPAPEPATAPMPDTASPDKAPRRTTLGLPALLLALLVLVLLIAQWMFSQQRLHTLQEDIAHRLSEGDAMAQANRTLNRQTQEDVQGLIARIGVLEARLNEAQGHQAALEAMYQELASSRDERLLAEIEQSIAIASQQLQLAGNVEAALIALQGAEGRLARSNNSQFVGLRRLLTRDIDRLKALPQADISGMAVKLESVVAVVDTLPLAYTQRPPSVEVKKADSSSDSYWQKLWTEFWHDMSGLVRIERMDQDVPALLAPSQAIFLRENLRLRLINARLSLLQRDAKSFHDDLQLAAKWLTLYFDMRSNNVKSAHDALQKMSGTQLNLALPALDETLTAVRNIKLPRDKK